MTKKEIGRWLQDRPNLCIDALTSQHLPPYAYTDNIDYNALIDFICEYSEDIFYEFIMFITGFDINHVKLMDADSLGEEVSRVKRDVMNNG